MKNKRYISEEKYLKDMEFMYKLMMFQHIKDCHPNSDNRWENLEYDLKHRKEYDDFYKYCKNY